MSRILTIVCLLYQYEIIFQITPISTTENTDKAALWISSEVFLYIYWLRTSHANFMNKMKKKNTTLSEQSQSTIEKS